MDLDAIRDEVTSVLDATYRAREIGLTNSRKVIRLSANAIRSLHRDEIAQAEALMVEAGELLRETVEVLAESPDILHAGFVHDAAKEYAEARLTAALGSGAEVPGPAELGVAVPAFLMGMAFPSGIRTLEARGRKALVPWVWGVNGATSVLASVAAIIIAIEVGYTAVFVIGASCYLLSAPLFALWAGDRR